MTDEQVQLEHEKRVQCERERRARFARGAGVIEPTGTGPLGRAGVKPSHTFQEHYGEFLGTSRKPLRLPGDLGRGPAGRPHGRVHVALDLAIVVLAVADLYLLALALAR